MTHTGARSGCWTTTFFGGWNSIVPGAVTLPAGSAAAPRVNDTPDSGAYSLRVGAEGVGSPGARCESRCKPIGPLPSGSIRSATP